MTPAAVTAFRATQRAHQLYLALSQDDSQTAWQVWKDAADLARLAAEALEIEVDRRKAETGPATRT